jgi:molybdopterin molybdotransferase
MAPAAALRDELAEPGSAASRPGAIPESVSFGVAALAEEWGASIQDRIRLPDDLTAMERAATNALDQADLVVVTGGASVGEKDFAKAMFEAHGLELLFSKVAIKPGKPVWLGQAKGKLVMGLPGNPTSALATARLLLAPLVAGLSGLDPQTALRWRKATLLASLPACGDRETFVRAREFTDGVEPASNQDSSAQKMLVDADLLIRRRAGAVPARAGDIMTVLDF